MQRRDTSMYHFLKSAKSENYLPDFLLVIKARL